MVNVSFDSNIQLFWSYRKFYGTWFLELEKKNFFCLLTFFKQINISGDIPTSITELFQQSDCYIKSHIAVFFKTLHQNECVQRVRTKTHICHRQMWVLIRSCVFFRHFTKRWVELGKIFSIKKTISKFLANVSFDSQLLNFTLLFCNFFNELKIFKKIPNDDQLRDTSTIIFNRSTIYF